MGWVLAMPEATSFGQCPVSHCREPGDQLNEAFTTAAVGDSFARAGDDAAADRVPAGRLRGCQRSRAALGGPALVFRPAAAGGRAARPPASGRRAPR
jgi:hypothetical protein